jgi:hypothetical protein
MVLAVFAILGITYQWVGTTQYDQTAQAFYNLKAIHLAQAALEEARGVVYDKVNRPPQAAQDRPPEWKEALFKKVDEALSANPTGTTDAIVFRGGSEWVDLLGAAGLVEKAPALARDIGGDAAITECKVKFYGFRRIPYNKEASTYDKDAYYQDKDVDKDAAALVPNDAMGYYTIRAAARSRGHVRTLLATHDVKIVNVSPIAPEFALFQALEVKNTTHSDTDLNEGGAFRVVPRGWGRVFMRGPYTVDIEGLPEGEGGYGPQDPQDASKPVSNAYLKTHAQRNEWSGWALVPNPRAAVAKRQGLIFERPQCRPKARVGGLSTTLQAISSGLIGLGTDPGVFIPENSVWFTGVKAKSDKEFSLIGDPRGYFQFSCFRGKKVRLASGGQPQVEAYWPTDDNPQSGSRLDLDGQFLPLPTGDDNWYLLPEANLKARLHAVRLNQVGFNWRELVSLNWPISLRYNVVLHDGRNSPGGVATNVYGMHWEPVRTRGILGSALDLLIGLSPLTVLVNPALLVFNVLNPSSFFSGSVPLGPGGASGTVAKHSLPPNFKGVYARAATRVYRKAARIKSFVDAARDGRDARLVLDGVLWAREELKLTRPFQYVGKGILGAKPSGGDAGSGPGPGGTASQDATITGPIVPAKRRDEEVAESGLAGEQATENYLTLVWQGHAENATGGSQMLSLALASGATLNPSTRDYSFDGTIYSTHGLKSESGEALILGNYVCGVVNKSRTSASSKIVVDYNQDLLRKKRGETADDTVNRYMKGGWHAVAVSHRVVGYQER